ncbi:MAG: glutathione S-transferase [Ottowia sp.]|uniref:glutathione S-transferase n=1 Tax=Ottowia sp. TaxID=1898956 RepID=UPI003C70D85A
MKLIGMLDSPYVRRTAISLRLLGVDFHHHSLSVFSTYNEFKGINPVVKAPTLVLDDGTVLMDSTLIIDYVEHAAGRSLMSVVQDRRARETGLLGLALAACEKTVQIVYERKQRPAEKQHEPWMARVREQLAAAYGELETAWKAQALATDARSLMQAEVTTAVAWRFTQLVTPDVISETDYPRLAELSRQAEAFPEFKAFPPV